MRSRPLIFALASVSETVTVTAAASETALTPTVATTVKAASIEVIPYGRSLDAATVLAPGAIGNGPGGNIMISGALSCDNLNLVNGVNVNENLRQQARPLYVEDAVQETKVSSGNISAEYGRFQGGVVNMITKSGGNSFSGSFRTTFTNDLWKALTPYPGDSNVDVVVPGYEVTLGGPVFRDKLWFFSAGRLQNNKTDLTMPHTGYNYTYEADDKRVEGKVTYALNAKVNYFLSTKSQGSHNFVGGFDYFDEMRMNNRNSVASGYRVQVTGAIIDGYDIYYSYWYQGPAVNTGATGPYLTSAQTLQILWDWFNANGGTTRPVRTSPTVVGVNTSVNPKVKSANSNEYMIGLAHQLGNGAVRVDYVYRRYNDFYGNYVNRGTGVVTDPRTNLQFNMTVVDNTNDVVRDYKGLSVQFDYRLRRGFQLSGNWMLSWSRGSVEGEDSTNGATRASANEYPEYRQASWNYPVGYTNGDQRHKVRVWGSYDLPAPDSLGRFALGFMQRFDSGSPWDCNFTIDTRPYVSNPGYLVPTSSVT